MPVVASVTAVLAGFAPDGSPAVPRRRFDLVAAPQEISGGRSWLTTEHATKPGLTATTTVFTASIRPVPRAWSQVGPQWVDGAPKCPKCGRVLADRDGFWLHVTDRGGCLWTD